VFAGFPNFFTGPLSRPVERHLVVPGSRIFVRTYFQQIFDLEYRCSQQSNPIAVRKVKFHAGVARPADLTDAERGALQDFLCGIPVALVSAECVQERIREKYQAAIRAE
jgi:hypothetical protein